MSSHTQPQKVQVALSMIERVIVLHPGVAEFAKIRFMAVMSEFLRIQLRLWFILALSIVRTGRRDGKHSPQGAALKTAAHPAGHKPPGFDLGPGSHIRHVAINGELQG